MFQLASPAHFAVVFCEICFNLTGCCSSSVLNTFQKHKLGILNTRCKDALPKLSLQKFNRYSWHTNQIGYHTTLTTSIAGGCEVDEDILRMITVQREWEKEKFTGKFVVVDVVNQKNTHTQLHTLLESKRMSLLLSATAGGLDWSWKQ